MFKIVIIKIVFIFIILFPLSVKSQSNVYLGPNLGIQKSQNADNANYLLGATLRAKLSPFLGLEGAIGYRQEKYGNNALTVRSWPVTVSGLLYPLPIAYGGLGAGWYKTTFDYSNTYNDAGFEDETSHKFGWHLLAGIELPASPNVILFGDIRYVFIDYKLKDLPNAVLDGDKSDFYSINIGLLFRI